MSEPDILIYLDQGALALFSKNYESAELKLHTCNKLLKDTNSQACARYAYSEASFWDLKNAQHQSRELNFLKDFEARYLEVNTEEKTVITYVDPFNKFENCVRTNQIVMGAIFSMIVGGGEISSFRKRITNSLERADLLDDRSVRQAIELQLEDMKYDDLIKKKDFSNAFYSSPKLNEGESLKQFISRQEKITRAELENIFSPAVPMSVNQRVCASLMLNFFLKKPAKGILGEKIKPSENEVTDAFHIAASLCCSCFISTDKGSLLKYQMLAKYWDLRGRAAEICKVVI